MRDLEAVFIDRDGTIGGTGGYMHPSEFKLYEYTHEAIDLLKKVGIKVFAFTNQPGVERGQVILEDLIRQFEEYGFDKAYICPHNPKLGCECRKPNTGMLMQAAREYSLNLKKCAVIGDMGDTDMLAAHRVNAIKILVRTGCGESYLNEYREKWSEVQTDYVAENLLDAVKWLLK